MSRQRNKKMHQEEIEANGLTRTCNRVIELKRKYDLSPKVISERLGIPTTSVHAFIKHARLKGMLNA